MQNEWDKKKQLFFLGFSEFLYFSHETFIPYDLNTCKIALFLLTYLVKLQVFFFNLFL